MYGKEINAKEIRQQKPIKTENEFVIFIFTFYKLINIYI